MTKPPVRRLVALVPGDYEALAEADLFIAMGTSGAVYPAADNAGQFDITRYRPPLP